MNHCISRIGSFQIGLFILLLLPPRRCEAQEPNLEALWADLAEADASKAYRAIWALALKPEKMVPFLKARLQPASGDRKEIDKLIRDLGSEIFANREKAIGELERLSDAAEEALKQALQEKPSVEVRRRIELLLSRIPAPAGSPALVRQERALEALELAGTREAQDLVKHLADGNAAARWTRMAKAVHARLADKPRLPDMPAQKVDAIGDELPAGTLARLGTIRMQSGYWAAIAADGKSLVTASNKSLQAWDITAGRALSGFPQSKDWPECRAIAISPDGKLVGVAYNRAYSFDICELPGGKIVYERPGKGETREPCQYAVAFSKDSKTFIITNQSGIQLWDMTTGKLLQSIPHLSNLHKAAISTDGRRVTTASHNGSLRIWDVAEGKLLHDLGDQKTPVYSATMNADWSRLASYGPGPSVRIWDGSAGKLIREIPLAGSTMHGDPSPSFAFSPDGTTLAMLVCVRKGDPEQHIQMWNLADLDLKPRILAPPAGIGRLEAFTPDGKSLLWRTGSSYRLLDATTGKDRHGWASRGAVRDVAWSRDGERIATAVEDGAVNLWDANTGKRLHTLIGSHRGVGRVAFSPDNKLLATFGAPKVPAILWDAMSGEKKAELDNCKNDLHGVYWAGFSADSKLLYTGGLGSPRGVFDTATAKLLSEFNTDRISTWHMAFSGDGRFAAVGIDGVHIFDLTTKKMRHRVESKQCYAFAFSPDGRTLALVNNGQREKLGDVVLWETLTGGERARFSLPKAYLAYSVVAFAPNCRMLAVMGGPYAPHVFQVLDLGTQKQLGPFPGHLDRVTAVAFSPDSRRMATASSDGTVLIRIINNK